MNRSDKYNSTGCAYSRGGTTRRFVCSALFFVVAAACWINITSQARGADQPRDERMQWWREARFGMFIHWGVYSVPAGTYEGKQIGGIGEWIMNRAKIPVANYKKYAAQFNPVKYDPDQWVRLAKEAGMKYIVITSKHHDGFALFDSKVTDWDIVDATPYGKDLLKPLAEACKRYGLKLGFYYSEAQDWCHPGGAASGGHWDSAQDGDMDEYIRNIAVPQVKEILTNYGKIAVLWWDTPTNMNKERADMLLPLTHLQPGIITNNRLGGGYRGDFSTPEQHIPDTGLDYDWETCMTMNGTWGYKSYDHNWKSTETLIRNLVDIASKGGNYLLNVGPTSEGLMPEPSVIRLKEIGKWMKVNGESIYGTTASPFEKFTWGRCTQKQLPGNKTRLYLHIFDRPTDGKLKVAGLDNKILRAFLLTDEKRGLSINREGNDVIIKVPSEAPDAIASVVAVDIEGKPVVIYPPEIAADADTFVNSIDVVLKSKVKDSQIRYTLDGSNPTADSPLYNKPITVKDDGATVTARLFRDGRAISGPSERKFRKVTPRPAAKVENLKTGLAYEYYEGDWNKLPDFDSLKPKATGTSETFGISLRRREENFGLRFSGYLKIPRTGVYRFYLASDDGSKLYLSDQCVIDNDGLHTSSEKTGTIALAAGLLPITVALFEKTGDQELKVFYSGPGLEKQTVPVSALFHRPKEQIIKKDQRMKWWRQGRFGMFIHWGLYAVPAGTYEGKQIGGIGEWIMDRGEIPIAEYEKYAAQFKPVKFKADEWVRIAKKAGMKYIVITSKHHDGFCLWDSKVTDYDIMDAAPFKRDILRELADACKKAGIRMCFYHSIMDWHHPDAQGPFSPNYNDTSRSNPNFPRYVETYLKPQIKELIKNYGPLGILWFDGEWVKDWTEEMGKDMYRHCLSLQPDIIVNNRVGKGRSGMQGMSDEDSAGDYGTPEQQIPPRGLPGVDWETCMTMNDTWGFKSYDHNWKSTEDLIRKLVDIASKGGNFLLNVGPTAEGLIPGPSVERLEGMGKWMSKNSESIYGTSASLLGRVAWGRCTARGKTLYLHVFDWPKDGKLEVQGPTKSKVARAYLLAEKDNGKLRVSPLGDAGGIVINLPAEAPDPVDTVIVLELTEELEPLVNEGIVKQAGDGCVTLGAFDATVHGGNARYESGGGKDNIGYWTSADDYVTWKLNITKPGTFDVEITFACEEGAGGSEYAISVAGQELTGKIRETGGWTRFVTEKPGSVKIGEAGEYELSVKPKSMPGYAVMNLKSVKLVPAGR